METFEEVGGFTSSHCWGG